MIALFNFSFSCFNVSISFFNALFSSSRVVDVSLTSSGCGVPDRARRSLFGEYPGHCGWPVSGSLGTVVGDGDGDLGSYTGVHDADRSGNKSGSAAIFLRFGGGDGDGDGGSESDDVSSSIGMATTFRFEFCCFSMALL